MSTQSEDLKISLAQRIMGITDHSILDQVNKLLNKNNIVGYNTFGNPIYEAEYILEMDETNNQINEKTATTYSTKEVKKRILDENNLA